MGGWRGLGDLGTMALMEPRGVKGEVGDERERAGRPREIKVGIISDLV